MVEEKRCDSLMLKWEEDLSDGLRVMLHKHEYCAQSDCEDSSAHIADKSPGHS